MSKEKVNVSLWIPRSLDNFMKELCKKTIVVNEQRIQVNKTKNDIYNRAIEYAIEKIDEWYF